MIYGRPSTKKPGSLLGSPRRCLGGESSGSIPLCTIPLHSRKEVVLPQGGHLPYEGAPEEFNRRGMMHFGVRGDSASRSSSRRRGAVNVIMS